MRRLYDKTLDLLAELFGWPRQAVPADMRDSLDLRRYERLQERIPVLYLTLSIVAIAAGFATGQHFSISLNLVLPAIMLSACAARMIYWKRAKTRGVDADAARASMRRSTILAAILIAFGSAWTVLGYFTADETRRALAPVFILISCFACANSMSSVPVASILALTLGLVPISAVMIASGDAGLIAMAVSMLLVTGLQVRMIVSRYVEIGVNLVLQNELETIANTDALTGVHNRRAFTARLDRSIERGQPFALVMMDLDGFKPVNDRHGHGTGDALLCSVAQRLRDRCGPSDFVARIGGDEFALILGDPGDVASLERWSGWIKSEVAKPYGIAGLAVRVSASVGVAAFPDEAHDAETLLTAADRALYTAKSAMRRRSDDRPAIIPQPTPRAA